MTVAELIQSLQEFPGDLEVLVSHDAEGNTHSPMEGVYDYAYDGEDLYDPEQDDFFDPEDVRPVVVIWPV